MDWYWVITVGAALYFGTGGVVADHVYARTRARRIDKIEYYYGGSVKYWEEHHRTGTQAWAMAAAVYWPLVLVAWWVISLIASWARHLEEYAAGEPSKFERAERAGRDLRLAADDPDPRSRVIRHLGLRSHARLHL